MGLDVSTLTYVSYETKKTGKKIDILEKRIEELERWTYHVIAQKEARIKELEAKVDKLYKE
jgi:hypothetical protein